MVMFILYYLYSNIIAVLICIYGISKLALSKKLKSFHIHFSVSNGFDLSATYDNISSEVTDNEE